MAESSRQKRIAGRVMHEFKHGELKSGRSGKGGLVKSRRQAIAIALEENTKLPGVTVVTFIEPNARKQRAGPRNSNAKAGRMPAPTASGKAPRQ